MVVQFLITFHRIRHLTLQTQPRSTRPECFHCNLFVPNQLIVHLIT